jgi:hypothetical protein
MRPFRLNSNEDRKHSDCRRPLLAMADDLRTLEAARKRVDYAQRRSVDPFSSALKRTVLQVWDITHREDACVAAGSWWWHRFKSHVALQPRITPAHVAMWVATRAENNDLTAPSARHAQKELFFAWQHWTEWQTSQWLLQHNMKGLAVPSQKVAHYYLQRWPRPCATAEMCAYVERLQRPAYTTQWLRIFRRRWGITWRRLPAKNPVPPDELRRKATSLRNAIAGKDHARGSTCTRMG